MAGTIDQLNFEVLVKDDKFNEKIQADIKLAKEFNVELSELLDLQAKASKMKFKSGDATKQAADMAKLAKATAAAAMAEEKLRAAKNATAASAEKLATAAARRAAAESKAVKAAADAAAAQERLNNAIKRGSEGYGSQSRLLGDLRHLALQYFSVRGVMEFTQELVKVTGQYEAQRAALRAILQDEAGADRLLEKFQDLALYSPFTFQDLTGYAKQLAAVGVPIEDIYETTKRLADVSAGVGVDLSRIILAYGQVRSATFLKGSELRQFTEAGIPLVEILAEQFTKLEGKVVTVAEVFDRISARQVSFDAVAQAFKTMTSEGGKFYNMQETLSQTVQGHVSNLRDAFEKMLYTIGEEQSGVIKKSVNGLRVLMENYEYVGKTIAGLVTTLGTYKTTLIAIKAYQKAVEFVQLAKSVGLATAAMQALNIASKANIYIALASAVLGVVAALTTFNRKHKETLTESGKAAQAYEKEARALKDLYDAAKDESASMEERNEAISKINNQYGEYLNTLLTEKSTVDDLTQSYNDLSQALKEKFLAQQKEAMTGTQREEYGEAEADFYAALAGAFKGAYLSYETRGKLTKEIQDLVEQYAGKWGTEDLIEAISEKVTEAGGTIDRGDMRKLRNTAEKMKDAEIQLGIAESAFEQFARGYQDSMDIITESSGTATDEVITTVSEVVGRIEAGLVEIAKLEKKAKGAGLTEEERKRLSALREQDAEDRKEYRELTGEEYGKTSDETDRRIKEVQEQARRIARETVKAEAEVTRAGIEAMEEGEEKRKALLAFQHQQRLQQIAWDYEDAVAKMGESPELSAQYAKRVSAEELRYAAEVSAVDKAVYRQRLENQREYMKNYGTLKEKELAIVEEYDEKIRKARAEGDEYLAKSLENARDEELEELRRSYSGLYALMFSDAKDLASSQIAKAIELTQAEIEKATKSGKIEELTELYERLRDLMSEQGNRKYWGFGGLAAGFKLLKSSEDAYKKALDGNDKTGVENAIADRVLSLALIEKSGDEISELFDKLGKSLEAFGGTLGEVGSAISGLASNTDNIVTAFKSENKADLATAGLDSALKLAEMIGAQIQENRRAQEEWNLTVRQCAHEYAMLELAALDYQQSSIFGVESPYKKAIDSMKQYAEAMGYLREQMDAIAEGQVQTGTKQSVSGKNIGTGIAAGAGLGAVIGSVIPGLGTAIGAAIGAAVGAIAGALTTETVPVFDSLANKYGSILKEGTETFELNPKILADYDKLDEATKKLVDNWEEIRNKALEAQEEMRASIAELVGDMGDTLSDMLIDAFTNGDVYAAVDDFKAHVTDMIEDITQKIIFAAIFEKAFKDLQKKMEDSFGPEGDQDIRDELLEFLKQIPGLVDLYAQAIKQAKEEANAAGLDIFGVEGAGGQSLGDGIKGITEETAGLLASYLNGMRSDLSFMRGLQARYLPVIGEAIPSIMEYQARIAANTYETARRAAEIALLNQAFLSKFESVIDYEGGQSTVRVS